MRSERCKDRSIPSIKCTVYSLMQVTAIILVTLRRKVHRQNLVLVQLLTSPDSQEQVLLKEPGI